MRTTSGRYSLPDCHVCGRPAASRRDLHSRRQCSPLPPRAASEAKNGRKSYRTGTLSVRCCRPLEPRKGSPPLPVVSQTDFLLQHSGRTVDDCCAGSKPQATRRGKRGELPADHENQAGVSPPTERVTLHEQGRVLIPPGARLPPTTSALRRPSRPSELPPGPSLTPHQARPFFARRAQLERVPSGRQSSAPRHSDPR